MDFETLTFDVRDGVARITLDRPDAANSLNRQMGEDLWRASIQCDVDPDIRAVLLTATGSMFCAGGDLKSFSQQGNGLPAHLKEVTTFLHGAISRFAWMDAPLIAGVNGTAAGAGMSLVCAADLVIATQSARFTMAYTRAGLVPDGSSTFYLAKVVGLHRAKELALTNRVLTANEACEWGLVNQVVADDTFVEETETFVQALADGPVESFGATKRLLMVGMTETLETQMDRETRAIAAAAGSAEGREGVGAFLGKRAPNYRDLKGD